jgi:cell division protein FtsL
MGIADAYKVQQELKTLAKAINELSQIIAKIDKRVASLEKTQPAKP